MCGIAGIIGKGTEQALDAMLKIQYHRGPDFTGKYVEEGVFLGHNRLSIIDLHPEANQPFISSDGEYYLIFNGELYNYIELKEELKGKYQFRTQSDSEVLLAAYIVWGKDCLERFRGMYSFVIFHKPSKKIFAARDRFGVKPFHYYKDKNVFVFASEIKTLFASGLVPKQMNMKVWANYLAFAQYNLMEETFFDGVHQLPGGHYLEYLNGELKIKKYYDFVERVNAIDYAGRSDDAIRAEIKSKLLESIDLRLRADVKRGFNLSGGIDSTLLFLLIKEKLAPEKTKAFTFYCNDPEYDELEWVKGILKNTRYDWVQCLVDKNDFAERAIQMHKQQDEPYAGLATMAYARTFEEARKRDYIVVLDGSGMDEQIGGYDYYYNASGNLIQGSVNSSPVRPECMHNDLLLMAKKQDYPKPFDNELKDLQYRDTFYTKLPRDLRMTDRASMAYSVEMREPFMDHELFEMSFALPVHLKNQEGKRKWIMREIVKEFISGPITEAPKRPIQTPQREWLRNEQKEFVTEMVNKAVKDHDMLYPDAVNDEMRKFFKGESDNSFYVWQWVSLGLSET